MGGAEYVAPRFAVSRTVFPGFHGGSRVEDFGTKPWARGSLSGFLKCGAFISASISSGVGSSQPGEALHRDQTGCDRPKTPIASLLSCYAEAKPRFRHKIPRPNTLIHHNLVGAPRCRQWSPRSSRPHSASPAAAPARGSIMLSHWLCSSLVVVVLKGALGVAGRVDKDLLRCGRGRRPCQGLRASGGCRRG